LAICFRETPAMNAQRGWRGMMPSLARRQRTGAESAAPCLDSVRLSLKKFSLEQRYRGSIFNSFAFWQASVGHVACSATYESSLNWAVTSIARVVVLLRMTEDLESVDGERACPDFDFYHALPSPA
jgi:hypothetical protein